MLAATALVALGFAFLRDIWPYSPLALAVAILISSCLFGAAVVVLTKSPKLGCYTASIAAVITVLCNLKRK